MALAPPPGGSRCPRARECPRVVAHARALHPRTAAHNGSPVLRLYSADTRGTRASSSPYADLLAATERGGHGKFEKCPNTACFAVHRAARDRDAVLRARARDYHVITPTKPPP